MKADRQRIAHVGHQREVEKPGEVEFILQPAGVCSVVLSQDAGERPPLGGLIAARPYPIGTR